MGSQSPHVLVKKSISVLEPTDRKRIQTDNLFFPFVSVRKIEKSIKKLVYLHQPKGKKGGPSSRITMAAKSYKDIDRFNDEIIQRNFLSKMLFSADVAFQNNVIAMMIAEIKHEFKKLSPKHTLIAITETLQMFDDPTGEVLKENLRQSFGEHADVDRIISLEEKENLRKEQMIRLLKCFEVIAEQWPAPPEYKEGPEKKKTVVLGESSNLHSEYEKLKIQRNYFYQVVMTKHKDLEQLITYKRLILFLQINVYARSKGLFLREQGGIINHMAILKDIRDILFFSAPILWKNILDSFKNTDPSRGHVFPFPSNYLRNLTLGLYEGLFCHLLDSILNIQSFDDDLLTKIPLDGFLKSCRYYAMKFVQMDPKIKRL